MKTDALPVAGDEAPSPRGQLAALTLGHFMVDFYGGFLAPLQKPTLLIHYAVPIAWLTALVAISGFWCNLLQPLFGAFVRSASTGRWLVFCPLASAVTACMGLTHSYAALVGLVLVSGVAIAFYHPEGMLAAHAVRGVRDSLAMPIFGSGGFLGWSAGMKVAAWWGTHKGLDDFWWLLVPGVVSTALLLYFRLGRLEGHADEPPAETGAAGPHFALILVLGCFLTTTHTFYSAFITRELVDTFGAPAQDTGGTALFAFGLFGAMASYGWAAVSDRIGGAATILLGQLLGIGAYWMVLQSAVPGASPDAVVVWSLVAGVALWGSFPVMLTMGRRARGLTPRLRAGLSMGGTWGFAGLALLVSSRITDEEALLLRTGLVTIGGAAVVALAIALAPARANRDNGQVSIPDGAKS